MVKSSVNAQQRDIISGEKPPVEADGSASLMSWPTKSYIACGQSFLNLVEAKHLLLFSVIVLLAIYPVDLPFLLISAAMKRLLFLLFLAALSFAGFGQQTLEVGENYYGDRQGILYDRAFTVDLKLHTNGFAFGVDIARIRTYYLTTFLNFEFGEIKHPKQFRQSFDFRPSTNGQVSRAFVYGKENNFYVLRAGYGQKRFFSEKAKEKGLAIGISYQVGPALGLLKPYYLELLYPESGGSDIVARSERFSEENANVFLDITRIFGSSSWSEGLGEIAVRPGVQGEFAVHFDWGAFDEFVKALEAGVMFDVFLNTVPIMVDSPLVENTENRPFFINFFLKLQLGKRW